MKTAASNKNASPPTPEAIRRMMADGKHKMALDAAKELHKAAANADSEALLIDAYAGRIRSLTETGMPQEAAALRTVVLERFPHAVARLAQSNRNSPEGIADLLAPLTDPALPATDRKAVEDRIRTEIWDLAAIAGCPALPPDHPLRAAAAALDKAFVAVTSRAVTDEELQLPEVSHRSPLSPWKLLVRAIADFHRGDDSKCPETLGLLNPDSVPARLVPALNSLVGGSKAARSTPELPPAAARLVDGFRVKTAHLKSALLKVQTAFDNEANLPEVRKAIELAVAETRKSAPDLVEQVKRCMYIRSQVEGFEEERIVAALGSGIARDPALFRSLALAFEATRSSDYFPDACMAWNAYLQGAFEAGAVTPTSMEAGVIYLHMAELLSKSDDGDIADARMDERAFGVPEDELYYLDPQSLFQLACTSDPHTDAFAKWLRATAAAMDRKSASKPEKVRETVKVAEAWHAALPRDIEPLLFLMDQADERNAFKKALEYLERAERIDQVNPKVRAARLRLLARAVIGHLKRDKPLLAKEKLASLAELPAASQGDRAAVVDALAWKVSLASGELDEANRRQGAALEKLGENGVRLLFNTVGNQVPGDQGPIPKDKRAPQDPQLAKTVARVATAAREFGFEEIWVTTGDLKEVSEQIPKLGESLSTPELLALSTVGLQFQDPAITFSATAIGLGRSPETDPRFLVDRAACLPDNPERIDICAEAAVVLGREQRDTAVVDDAIEINPYAVGSATALTLEQARDVVRREKLQTKFPKYGDPGPDYDDLLGVRCDCPACRRKRGDKVSPRQEEYWLDQAASDMDQEDALEDDGFDADFRRQFFSRLPEGIPPVVARRMFDIFADGIKSGEEPAEVLARLQTIVDRYASPEPGTRKGKGR